MNNNIKKIITAAVAAALILSALMLSGCGSADEFFAEQNEKYGQGTSSGGERKAAADFTVQDKNGNKVSLSSKKGRPVVVNFWATWCGPCVSELGHFDSAFREYGDRVEFMIVNLTDNRNETVSGVKAFISENGYGFPVYFDTEFSASEAYGVNAIPMTLFIDENGDIVNTRTGAMDAKTLDGYLNELLEAN